MADRKHVAERDGPHRTNKVIVEPGHFLDPRYKFVPFNQKEITPTGLHKVLEIVPVDDQVAGPRFRGRSDKKGDALDFDLLDRNGTVRRAKPHGHHAKALGGRRFEVEIGLDANRIVFRGIVRVAFGIKIHVGGSL